MILFIMSWVISLHLSQEMPDKTASFQSIFAAEKANVTAFNKAYVTQNASEYFAESVKDYILNNASLKSSRPQT